MMKNNKNEPNWVQKKQEVNDDKHDEVLEFVGESGVDSVVDGKLPNGEPYLWKKRRK